jgi:hypothetical protein
MNRLRHKLISGGVSPIIPTIRSNDARHVCCRKHHSGINSPSSPKPYSPSSTVATIHEGKTSLLFHRLPPMSCDIPANHNYSKGEKNGCLIYRL